MKSKQLIALEKEPYLTQPDLDPELQQYLRKMALRKQIKKRGRELAKLFLKGLLITGAVCIAATSPYFLVNLLRSLMRCGLSGVGKKDRKQLSDMFSYFRRRGLINISKEGQHIRIALSEDGKKLANQYQIDDLVINKPKAWDEKWRVLIFDIPEQTRIKREILRGKLKELGFKMLQKSVWVHPYPCEKELNILKGFFGFTSENYLFFETTGLSKCESKIREFYKLP